VRFAVRFWHSGAGLSLWAAIEPDPWCH